VGFLEYLGPRQSDKLINIFHNEEFHNLFCSPDVARKIKSRNVLLVEHVACMREDTYKTCGEEIFRKPKFYVGE
jgi:hypothetical protein